MAGNNLYFNAIRARNKLYFNAIGKGALNPPAKTRKILKKIGKTALNNLDYIGAGIGIGAGICMAPYGLEMLKAFPEYIRGDLVSSAEHVFKLLLPQTIAYIGVGGCVAYTSGSVITKIVNGVKRLSGK